MKRCIKKNGNGSRVCAIISEKEGTPLSKEAASYNKDDMEWWVNDENSYDAELNWIDGNWYYYLFKRMSGSRRR